MGSQRLGSHPGRSWDTPKTVGSGGPTTSPTESPHEVLERKPERTAGAHEEAAGDMGPGRVVDRGGGDAGWRLHTGQGG